MFVVVVKARVTGYCFWHEVDCRCLTPSRLCNVTKLAECLLSLSTWGLRALTASLGPEWGSCFFWSTGTCLLRRWHRPRGMDNGSRTGTDWWRRVNWDLSGNGSLVRFRVLWVEATGIPMKWAEGDRENPCPGYLAFWPWKSPFPKLATTSEAARTRSAKPMSSRRHAPTAAGLTTTTTARSASPPRLDRASPATDVTLHRAHDHGQRTVTFAT